MNVVANGFADKCEMQVSYAIGRNIPISISLETFDTEKIPKKTILDIINKKFDFSVTNIIQELDLKRPIYLQMSCYGHFGNKGFPWEKIIPLN